MAGSSGSIWVSLGLRTENFSKGLSKARGQLNGFQKFSAGLKSMFNPLTIGMGAIAGIGAAFANATKIVTEFEKANSTLEAILGANEAQMTRLSDQAKKLGSTTAFTASQVTELQTEFARLGFPTDSIINMTNATLSGAAALGSELGEQAALVGAVLKQYGLDAREASRVNDVMAASASGSALDFQKLATAMPIVGATASSAGVSLERTTALLGTLSDRGLDASSSGTALRNVFLELSKSGLTWDEAMAKINTATDKNAVALELFGKRGATAGVILAESSVSSAEFTKELEEANGAAKLMAQTMLDNVAGDVTVAQSAWEGFVLSLEDGNGIISKLTRSVTQLGTTYLNMLTEMNNGNIDGIANAWMNHIGVVDDTMKTYETATGKVVLSQDELVRAGQNSQAALDELAKRFKSGAIDAAKFQKGVEMLADGYKKLTPEEKALRKEQELQAEENRKLQEETDKLAAAQLRAKEAAKQHAKELEKLLKKVEDGEKKFDEFSEFEVDGFTIDTSAAEDLANIVGDLDLPPVEIDIEPVIPDEEMAKLKAKNERMREIGEGFAENLTAAMEGAMVAGFSAVGQAIGGTDISAIGDSLIQSMSGLLSSFGQQMIVLGLGMESLQKSLALGPLGAGIAIAGGIALIAIGAAIKSSLQEKSTGFADGGLVTGSVFGNVGEGRGTTKSNPELIMPVDRLQKFLDVNQGGGMMGEVKFRIEGSTLVGILKRESKSTKFSS